MSWITAVLIAILFGGFSDIFRKLASDARDPYFINLVYQFAALITAFVLFYNHRKFVIDTKEMAFAVVAGSLISVATVYALRALAIGPGVSVVMPVFRVGATFLTVILGFIILREKITLYTAFGLLLSTAGMYLLFLHKG